MGYEMKYFEDFREAKEAFKNLAKSSKYTMKELVSARRVKCLVDERQRIAKIMRALEHSYPAIGAAMFRDHSSIMHLCKHRGQ